MSALLLHRLRRVPADHPHRTSETGAAHPERRAGTFLLRYHVPAQEYATALDAHLAGVDWRQLRITCRGQKASVPDYRHALSRVSGPHRPSSGREAFDEAFLRARLAALVPYTPPPFEASTPPGPAARLRLRDEVARRLYLPQRCYYLQLDLTRDPHRRPRTLYLLYPGQGQRGELIRSSPRPFSATFDRNDGTQETAALYLLRLHAQRTGWTLAEWRQVCASAGVEAEPLLWWSACWREHEGQGAAVLRTQPGAALKQLAKWFEHTGYAPVAAAVQDGTKRAFR